MSTKRLTKKEKAMELLLNVIDISEPLLWLEQFKKAYRNNYKGEASTELVKEVLREYNHKHNTKYQLLLWVEDDGEQVIEIVT